MEIAEPMRSRWSPTIFDPAHTLDEGQLDALLEAARWAPSYGNVQPWRFAVLARGTERHRDFCEDLSRGNSSWVPRASVVIVAAAQVGDIPDEYAFYGLGQAVAQLVLQAHAMGLHAHQFAGFDHAAAAEQLELPQNLAARVAVAVGALGDPSIGSEREQSKQQRERTRLPVTDLLLGGA